MIVAAVVDEAVGEAAVTVGAGTALVAGFIATGL
jgi:hypothetical protein